MNATTMGSWGGRGEDNWAGGRWAQEGRYRVLRFNLGGYEGQENVEPFGWLLCDQDFPDDVWQRLTAALANMVDVLDMTNN